MGMGDGSYLVIARFLILSFQNWDKGSRVANQRLCSRKLLMQIRDL
jgi:hypothetical protein